MNNKHDFNEFDIIAAKKSRKDMIDARSDQKLNGSEAEIFQSTH